MPKAPPLILSSAIVAGLFAAAAYAADAAPEAEEPAPPRITITEPATPGEKRVVEVIGDWHINETIRATDTTVQYCYGVTFSWKDTEVGVLRGKRFNAGPSPDSIIIIGKADVVLEDSSFPLALGLYTEKGGQVTLDLPINEPLTRTFDGSALLGAEKYKAVLKNVTVPHWFVMVRNIWPNNPPCEIVLDRCESLLLSLLGHGVTGEVYLDREMDRPVEIMNVTVRKGRGPLNLHMCGGIYLSGPDNDLTLRGTMPLAETMLWGGRLRMEGTEEQPFYAGCTTMDVHGKGHLTLKNVTLGQPKGNGQIIVRGNAVVEGEDLTLGRLILRTEEEGRIQLSGYQPTGRLTFEMDGGAIQLDDPRPGVP